MKYCVSGFNQYKLLEYGLDANDALILQWFIDFSGEENIKRYLAHGKSYCWVHYPTVLKEFPCFGIKNVKSISNRFEKYVSLGLLSREIKKHQKGTFAFYAQNIVLKELIYDPLNNYIQEIYALENPQDDLFSSKHKELHKNENSCAKENPHRNENSCANSHENINSCAHRNEYSCAKNNEECDEVNKIKDLELFEENPHSNLNYCANSHKNENSGAHRNENSCNPITIYPSTTKLASSKDKNENLVTKSEVLELVEGVLSTFMAKFEDILSSHKNENSCAKENPHSNINSCANSHENKNSYADNISHRNENSCARNESTETEVSEFSFYKNIIKKHYLPESFSQDIWKQLSSFEEKQYVKKADFEAYIDFVIENVKAKKPNSEINYFYKVVTTPSYAALFYEKYTQVLEKQEAFMLTQKECVACKTFFNVNEKNCPICGLAITQEGNKAFVDFHKNILSLSDEKKESLENEISTRNFESFKKYHHELSNLELQKIYFKYGLTMPV